MNPINLSSYYWLHSNMWLTQLWSCQGKARSANRPTFNPKSNQGFNALAKNKHAFKLQTSLSFVAIISRLVVLYISKHALCAGSDMVKIEQQIRSKWWQIICGEAKSTQNVWTLLEGLMKGHIDSSHRMNTNKAPLFKESDLINRHRNVKINVNATAGFGKENATCVMCWQQKQINGSLMRNQCIWIQCMLLQYPLCIAFID